MSDELKAFTDSLPTGQEFLKLWTAKAKEEGADVSKLLKSQADALVVTAKQAASAFGGSRRDEHRLDALLKLGRFNLECESFLEADAWTKALLEVLKELGESLLEVGAKAVVATLAASLKGAL